MKKKETLRDACLRLYPESKRFLEQIVHTIHEEPQVQIVQTEEDRKNGSYHKIYLNYNGNGYKALTDADRETILRGLGHHTKLQDIPGVQRIFSSGFIQEIPGIVGPLEYIPGINLGRVKRPMDAEELTKKMKTLDEETLTSIHQRECIHGDIKPGNIILTPEGKLILIDFSTARSFEEEREILRTNRPLYGTPRYCHTDWERSVDSYGLALTYAFCLLQDISLPALPNPLAIIDMARRIQETIRRTYGKEYEEFFEERISRPREYELSHTSKGRERKESYAGGGETISLSL